MPRKTVERGNQSQSKSGGGRSQQAQGLTKSPGVHSVHGGAPEGRLKNVSATVTSRLPKYDKGFNGAGKRGRKKAMAN
tara:strand:- start:10682 stop:10915 length:234 start_codon:yes stop_codon:yes gene_type:complete